ncbi:clusterin [Protopterus annectens]|uniref:clusterin n=1 Tax=Protopterus annectens TaxID=7888 RepID=UPI001CFAC70B|nr:clusterin [Protopterus annectens]
MKNFLFALLAFLFIFSLCYAEPTQKDLKQLSEQGKKYLETEIENAVNGVQQMKRLMEKTGKEHEAYLQTLRETKQKKEEALKLAKEAEEKLIQQQEGCNDTVMALWEDCKPCLKHTCTRYYSKVCSTGFGLMGRQLDEFLNETSPISIFINGQKLDSLLKTDEQQERRFEDLESRYTVVENGVHDIFDNGMQTYENTQPSFRSFFGDFGDFMRIPSFFQSFGFPFHRSRVIRDHHSVFHHNLYDPFRPLFEMTRKMFEQTQRLMEKQRHFFRDPIFSTGNYTVTSNESKDGQMQCKEIRRNSAGCLQLSEKCEKCKEIMSLDCSEKRSSDSLRTEYEDALRLSERFSKEYDDYLKRFEEEMLSVTSVIDRMNKQFGWVSKLAEVTGKKDGMFQVTTMYSRSENSEDPSKPADTNVTVQIFDSPAMTFTVPGEISWDDPKFMEIVTQEALERYKQLSEPPSVKIVPAE